MGMAARQTASHFCLSPPTAQDGGTLDPQDPQDLQIPAPNGTQVG